MNKLEGIHVIELNDENALPELAKLLGGIFGEKAKKKAARKAAQDELFDALMVFAEANLRFADAVGLDRNSVMKASLHTLIDMVVEENWDEYDLELHDFKEQGTPARGVPTMGETAAASGVPTMEKPEDEVEVDHESEAVR